MTISLAMSFTFLGYLVEMLGVGMCVHQRNRTLDVFVLGGRSLNS